MKSFNEYLAEAAEVRFPEIVKGTIVTREYDGVGAHRHTDFYQVISRTDSGMKIKAVSIKNGKPQKGKFVADAKEIAFRFGRCDDNRGKFDAIRFGSGVAYEMVGAWRVYDPKKRYANDAYDPHMD